MSDIGLILNAILGGLLVGALILGWRLEGRLKALRASHQSFTRAVEDLDRAAARAEQGLADLRAATDEAAETLAGRIERAKTLAASLERLTGEAAEAEVRLAAAPRPQVSRDSAFARFAERYGAAPRSMAVAPVRTDLILEEPAERASTVTRLRAGALQALSRAPQPEPQASAVASHRSRARVDDELFDAPPPRRSALGGAR
ncbi:MAG: DUF6468 domain-containing protein [Caulobacterales bacterium]